MRKNATINLWVALWVCLPICCAWAEPSQSAAVAAQIHSIQYTLQQQQATHDQLQSDLQATETALGGLNQQHQQTQRQLKTQQALLTELNQQQARYDDALAQQQRQLLAYVRMAYMHGQPNYLAVLLSQQDPTAVTRNLMYYRYLLQRQQQLLAELTATAQQVAANKHAIEQQSAQLLTLHNQQQQQIASIQLKHRQRTVLLRHIKSAMDSQRVRLQALLAHNQGLERVVQQAATSTAVPLAHTSFMQAKGAMNWPTRGTIVSRFHSSVEQSELKLNGVLISAPEGQNVYAIAAGKVAFAQWLPGYGLLLIIDHGDGYMSLYGRNASLYKKVGDAVRAGELVATVGKTGGYTASALYFAIRKQGQPLDPAEWCGHRA